MESNWHLVGPLIVENCRSHSFAPADGEYLIKISDAIYGGGESFFYRLELSTRPHIEYMFPPAGIPGVTSRFTVFGHNLPGATPVQSAVSKVAQFIEPNIGQLEIDIFVPTEATSLGCSPSNHLKEPTQVEVDGYVYRLGTATGASNPVFISHAQSPIVVEQEPNDDQAQPQSLSLPCEVVGHFFPSHDVDRFSFEAKKGQTYAISLFSERLAIPTDPAIVVQHVSTDTQGTETVRVVQEQDDITTSIINPPFDSPSHDVAIKFTADADGLYRVIVRDLYSGSNSHPRNIYRMTIGPPQSDFRLVATSRALIEVNPGRVIAGSPTLLQGGSQPILVQSYRSGGFDGPITLSVEGLPVGVSCSPVVMGPKQQQASLVASAAIDAAPWSGPVKVVGTATVDGRDIRRDAFASSAVWDQNSGVEMTFARITREATLAVIPERAPVSLSFLEEKSLKTARGGKLTVPIKIEHGMQLKGNPKLEARGLPSEIKMAPITLDAQSNDATVEITVEPNTPTGDYSLFLVLQAKGDYQRNLAAVTFVDDEKERFTELVSQLIDAAKAADAIKMESEKQFAHLTATADSPETAEARKLAEERKVEAIASAKVAQDVLNAALEEQKAIDRRLADATNAAKPKEIDTFSSSPTLTIHVAEVPLKLAIISPLTTLRAGESGEISITAERLFGFAGSIDLEPTISNGSSGITIEKVQIPPEQSEGKLIVKSDANSTKGNHQINIRVRLSYNGHKLQIELTADVKIEPAVE